MSISEMKTRFSGQLQEFAADLNSYVAMDDGQWTVKGFIDIYRNVYTISSDTKIVSKILEIHLFPMLLKFAERHSYGLVVADHQNYYPDISFVSKDNSDIRFAVDFKTTYRLPANPARCNGFTLGSHGEYFTNRNSTKNIQFPYSTYVGHYCLGIIYTRADKIDVDETQVHQIEQLSSITSVIRDFQFFAVENSRFV